MRGSLQLGLQGTEGQLTASGGNLSITNTAKSITTLGDHAGGLLLQSIGGGGGYSGSIIETQQTGRLGSGSYNGGGNNIPTPQLGSDYQLNAGNVSLTNAAAISTSGRYSPALLAQSIGGGGGVTGDITDGVLTMGMNGPAVANAGTVQISNTGQLLTQGSFSAGLLLQSVAGGGGVNSSEGNEQFYMGSLYGQQSRAGNINLTNSGNIQTQGQASVALLSQSIGGGGGYTASLAFDPQASNTADRLFLSAWYTKDAPAGDINVTNKAGTITTLGVNSPAVLIQSIGGGGGWNYVSGIRAAKGRLGKKSGTDGPAGDINVTNTANIGTSGDNSHALRIQSVGGGGGSIAANTDALSLGAVDGSSSDNAGPIALTGSQTGGTVTVTNTGQISTSGQKAGGLAVMSLGGGGGTVFGSIYGRAQMGSDVYLSNDVNLSAGSVTVSSKGKSITTYGTAALAAMIQSIGGGGGYVGDVIGDLLMGGYVSGLAMSNTVSVTNSARIATSGNSSPGLLAHSIGGGGGVTGPISGPISFALLGNLGSANVSAAAVSVNNSATINTAGSDAPALLAQSIGGGGGYTTTNRETDLIMLGSHGTGDLSAGNVSITNTAALQTQGRGAQALVAQSISGGGGFVGQASEQANPSVLLGATGNISNNRTRSELIAALRNKQAQFDQIDGNTISNLRYAQVLLAEEFTEQSGNGAAGSVSVQSTGPSLVTNGLNASVLLAQSIGGGGGWNVLQGADDDMVILGSLRGGSGTGGAVSVTNKAELTSQGRLSYGLVAQSIGGGGGAAGDGGRMSMLGSTQGSGDLQGGTITITNSGTIITAGAHSSGLLSQSIGGGGGMTADVQGAAQLGSLAVTGGNQNAGAISITNSGKGIQTEGKSAGALVAQSIGGGGGLLTDVAGELVMGSSDSGGSQQGGSVSISNNATLLTKGVNSFGLLAQSIGGGGGNSGINTSNYSAQLGSEQGTSLDGGAITVTNSGTVQTSGNNAGAINLQSIGGGGGLAASIANAPNSDSTTRLGSKGSIDANGATVIFTNTAPLTTTGAGSPALLLQSIGGGGGTVQAIDGASTYKLILGAEQSVNVSSGSVSLNHSKGTISTTGANAPAIVAQSIGGGGGFTLLQSTTATTLGGSILREAAAASVTATLSGNVVTSGDSAAAVVLQSIGGGGGYSGGSKGNGRLGASFSSGDLSAAAITLTLDGNLQTSANNAPVLLAQSIGGGGRISNLGGNASLGLSNDAATARVNAAAGAVSISIDSSKEGLVSLGTQSPTLLAQSIGGGGGVASNVSGNALLQGHGTGTLVGGAVTVNTQSMLRTGGDSSAALVAQSIGGGGGMVNVVSGQSLTLGTNSSGDATAAAVSVTTNKQVSTQGDLAAAIVAQSIGGGGGVAYTDQGSVTLGGDLDGLAGSAAVVVETSNAAKVLTRGDTAAGIVAQSIGGGGGYTGGSGSGALVQLGGAGRQLGGSGPVSVTLSKGGVVQTLGSQSPGVIAQSIGGGGGFTNQGGTTVTLGMSGGRGTDAAAVVVTNSGRILTGGDNSQGVIAQSIGGGGGSAGAAGTSVRMGATNGGGGSASGVVINNLGSGALIQTSGDFSHGVMAQSIGGGGGRATSAAGSIALGADDGSGDGAEVLLNNDGGTIATAGNYAPAYLIQSIGGGGGVIGISSGSPTSEVLLGGGPGGTAGSGGRVWLSNNDGTVQTQGQYSAAVIHQSIGGGGGWIGSVTASTVRLGGTTVGRSDGADLNLDLLYDVQTTGSNAPAVVLQSIGGGGGMVANVQGNVVLGSTRVAADVSAKGGTLSFAALNKTISTGGSDSAAVVLQSIGGGGGLVGSTTGSVTIGANTELASRSSGDAISATSNTAILTTGSNSPGVVAQSIGGGGGLISSPPVGITIGSDGRGIANAGAVSLTTNDTIRTQGSNAAGVILQSIGGGGGLITAGSGAIRMGGAPKGSSNAGTISFTNQAAITTTGANSPGVIAQGIAGGGGYVAANRAAVAGSLELGNSNAALSQGSDLNLTINQSITTGGDQSTAVIAQSIGGGGGFTTLPGTTARAGAIDGDRHAAGNVSVNLATANSTISTLGANADAIVAQSIGGGGGVLGSSSTSLQLGASRTAATDLEQLASSDGGSVTVSNAARIVTRGNGSIGVFAQSIGAGGGRAGAASGSITLGANGGRGDGGAVTLNLNGSDQNGWITTSGDTAPAFVLQSIGGGGGVVFPASTVATGALLLGGGSFGASGSGGSLSFLTNQFSQVTTTGDNSSGFVYQTIGGGGGFAGSTSASGQLGGRYAGTSSGSNLTVTSLYNVKTAGDNAPALQAQTIGGGGGRAGDIGTTVSLGGLGSSPSSSGKGGDLTIVVNSTLLSSGNNTATVSAQTIGGGGGLVGAVGGNASLGGDGAGDRRSGAVNLTISGNVSASGSNGAALLAQSIGGGGGGTAAVGGALNLGATGGTPGSDSRSGAITANLQSSQALLSSGDNSPVVLLQSIGGGGGFSSQASGAVSLGSAGASAGDQSAATISFTNAATITSSGSNAPAVVLQSIGMGGGYSFGGSSTSFGGSTSGTGHGADITITNSGNVSTSGTNSFGMLVQSIGGGGGVGGALSGTVNLPAHGNTASNSGSIAVNNSGLITTSGQGAHALVVQTLAGGGGFVLGGVARDSAPGTGTRTGSSGNIRVTNSGTISASGANSVALLFQNASGGAYLYQNPDGTVSAMSSAPDNDGGSAGEVVVVNTGVIESTGAGGIGITKSTNANDTHGNLRVENASGATIKGGPGGSAIVLVTEQVERVINYGSIIAGDKGKDWAITGVGGNDYVRNYGTIAGNISIPGADTDFYNAPSGRLESRLIRLDGKSMVVDAGTISPNGPYRIGTLDVVAQYIQTATGNYEADMVMRSGVTDKLNVTFASTLNGTVTLLPNQVGWSVPGNWTSQGIINTGAGVTLDGLELIAPKSAIASFAMKLINAGRDLAFDYTVNYAPQGLSPNSASVGQAINAIQAAGGTAGFEPTAALVFYDQTVSALNSTYRQLSGEAITAFSQVSLDAAQNFQNTINENISEIALDPEARCQAEQQQNAAKQPTGLGDSSPAPAAPVVAPCGTWRGWFQASGYNAKTPGQGSSNQASYSTTAVGTSFGADALVGPTTLVGGAARWDNLWTSAPSLSTGGVTTGWSGMLYAKQRLGPQTNLTAMLGAGSYSSAINRSLNLAAPANEKSTVNATAYSAQLGVSHRIPVGQGTITPKLNFSWLQLQQPAFSETTTSNTPAFQQPGNPLDPVPSPGKANYALKVASATYTSAPVFLGFDLSQPIKSGNTTFIPNLTLGYSVDLANTQRNLSAQFAAAPGHAFNVVGTPGPSQWWTAKLGLDVMIGDRLSLYASVLGQLAPGSTESLNYGGGFRWRF